jgi:hypothetical protein
MVPALQFPAVPGVRSDRIRVKVRMMCKLLLHLGNQRSFFVDNEKFPAYDFGTALFLYQSSASPLCG